MSIRHGHESAVKIFELALQVSAVVRDRDAVDTDRRVFPQAMKGASERRFIDQVGHCVELPFGLSFRSFRYPT